MHRTTRVRRSLAAASTLTAILFFSQATTGLAQSASVDPRWQPWIGCWTPAQNGMQPLVAPGAPAKEVCVIPAGASAVDIVNIVKGKVADRTHIDASGAQQAIARDGCNGWQRAQWSADDRRVYLRSESTCGGSGKHVASGLLAVAQNGEWLDVQGIGPVDNQLVRVVRYRALSDPADLPADVASALQSAPSNSGSARWAAEAPVALNDVVEASKNIDAPIVEAWLAERGQQFQVDAKELVKLADAGVPARVIDVIVAVSYPKVFAINQYSHTGDFRVDEPARETNPQRIINAGNMYYDPFGYSGYGYGGYGYGGYGAYGYSPYGNGGYSPYGYGSYGNQVIIVRVPTDGTTDTPRHGRVVKGHGYDDGSSSSSGSTSSSSGRSSSSGSSSSGSSSSGSSDSGSSGRTAHPRN